MYLVSCPGHVRSKLKKGNKSASQRCRPLLILDPLRFPFQGNKRAEVIFIRITDLLERMATKAASWSMRLLCRIWPLRKVAPEGDTPWIQRPLSKLARPSCDWASVKSWIHFAYRMQCLCCACPCITDKRCALSILLLSFPFFADTRYIKTPHSHVLM